MSDLNQASVTSVAHTLGAIPRGLDVAPAQRISPIDEAMVTLRNTQGATLRLLDDLASRLEPVLGAETRSEGVVVAKPIHSSQLHGEILACGYNAEGIHARIRDLIERLTV